MFEEECVFSELPWQSLGWTEGLAQPHWGLGRILLTPAMGMALLGLGIPAHRAEGDNPPRQKRDAVANHTSSLCCSINFILPFLPTIPCPPPCFQTGEYHVFGIPLTPWGSPGTAARTPAGGMLSSGSKAALSRAACRLSSGLCQDLGVTSQEKCL